MSRKYFGTDGIRGRVGDEKINPQFMLKLGWAVGKVLGRAGPGKVLIGKDTRVSGYMFESALEAGLAASGFDTCLVGPMPTPAIAYLTRTNRAAAGIVISASHNPYADNGIKLFSSEGTKFPDELELAIEAQLDEQFTTNDARHLGRAKRIDDAPGRYIEYCKSTFPNGSTLSGFKIVVDCANGATYHVAPDVFHELGADVVAIGVDPDGFNINEQCGATDTAQLQQKVLEENADLGVALDGDGDRIIMVDHEGNIVDGDALLYVISRYRLERGLLKGGIVGTLMSNFGLELAIKELGMQFVRAAVGDRHVMAELVKRGWELGGESSGHLICRDVATTGDGIVSALQVLAAICAKGRSLADLTGELTMVPQVMINIRLPQPVDIDHNLRIQAEISAAEEQLKNTGRVLLRKSGTEPLVRVMVEGKDEQQVKSLAKHLSEVVKEEVASMV